jgi:hypothetical protein
VEAAGIEPAQDSYRSRLAARMMRDIRSHFWLYALWI